jgi:hypothetical protein
MTIHLDRDVASIFLAACCAGCLAATAPGETPAQGAPAEPAAESEGPTANISGPVAYVDGKPARRRGAFFPVRPGCHVVRTDTNMVTSTDQVTVRVTIEPADFALPTRAGYEYFIERQFYDDRVRIQAHERDASGKVVQSFFPTKDEAELKACREREPR